METTSIKQEAHRLIEELADDATWDDLMYKIYVRKAIEAGLQDSEAERTHTIEEVRDRFYPISTQDYQLFMQLRQEAEDRIDLQEAESRMATASDDYLNFDQFFAELEAERDDIHD